MQFGAVFPTCEIGTDPIAIRDFAQAAEDLGYSYITTYDHVIGADHDDREPPLWGPYTEHDEFHEPLTLHAYLAAVTTKVELAVGVLVLPQRQTALVAKQAAEVDILSRGRLRLGVGTGWNYVEYDTLGVPFGARGRRLEEQVEVLRALWREPLVSFDGRYHKIERANIVPRPGRDIPVWFGGGSEPAMRRTARIGDGFVFGTSGDYVLPVAAKLRDLLAEEGRDPADFPMDAMADYCKGPEVWVAEREAWERAGGTHYSMRAMSTAAAFLGAEPPGFTTPAEHIKALQVFMDAVGPA